MKDQWGNSEIQVINDSEVSFAKKYLPGEYFDRQISQDYLNLEKLDAVSYDDLLTAAGDDEIWVYFDTGFQLHGKQIASETEFNNIITELQKKRPPTIRFYAKKK